MTLPRRIIAGTTYLLTRRCTQRRFMLVPRGVTPKLFGYSVALAAERYGISVHAVMCLSNHWHAVVTDPEGHISEFSRDVHSLVARALNAHFGRWEAFWSSQRLSLVELVDKDDVWEKLVYTLSNPVEAGLVATSSAWPGFGSKPEDALSGGQNIKRPNTRFFATSRLPEEVSLRVSAPPQLAALGKKAFVQEFRERVTKSESAIRARHDKPFMGPHAVKRQRRDGRPKTHARRRGLHPAIASRNRSRRLAMLKELRRFRDAYREARERWVNAKADEKVVFPAGTYKMRMYPGVVCERPPPWALQAA